MGKPTIDSLRKSFRFFAGMCAGYSDLYAELSPRVAEDDDLLALAAGAADGQPAVNLLFGAVQYLLLSGVEHELASHYPSVGGTAGPSTAWGPFAAFCREHADAMAVEIGSRRVQTNEIGRCGVLMPAFAHVRHGDERPLRLVELGASAGLNLLFDRYVYEYGDDRVVGEPSPVRIRTEVRGPVAMSVPERLPEVADRVGVDIAPVDVTDPQAIRWVEALIWPDQMHRLDLHRAARVIAASAPPTIVCGDGLDLTPDLARHAPADSLPCVFHSHAIYQMTRTWREAFEDRLDEVGRERDLAHVSIEWLDREAGPQLRCTRWTDGERRDEHLGACHHHGLWIQSV